MKPDLTALRSSLLTYLVLVLALAVAVTVGHAEPAGAQVSTTTAQQGLIFRGLSARAVRPCGNGYVVLDAGRRGACTHGPDPAPPGVDVRRQRSTTELRRATAANQAPGAPSDKAASAGSVACIGDGVSGDRVELVYAHASDVRDRYSEVAPLIESWAGEMNQAFADSAAENGGVRNLRFVTSGCRPVVDNVALSTGGDDDLGATSADLANQGYNHSDRKYIVFVDATVYCGIAYVGGNVARADQGCWDSHTGLHELTHNFGAVSLSAPNSSGGYHCTDESDVMCYSDSPYFPTMRRVCPTSHERLLDCSGDDYFNVRPTVENFLSTNPGLNVADTSFSVAEDQAVPVYLPPPPPGYQGPRYGLRTDNTDDDACAYVRTASGQRVRIFCIGYRGQREADITGALAALAGANSSIALELVATNRGGGKAYGFRLMKDGASVLDDRDGIAGGSSSSLPDGSPDPTTGWPQFYDRTLTLDLSAPPPPPPPPPPPTPSAGPQTPTQQTEFSTQQSSSSSTSKSTARCHTVQVLHTIRYRQRYRDKRGHSRYRWRTKPHLHRQRYRDRRGHLSYRWNRHYISQRVCS